MELPNTHAHTYGIHTLTHTHKKVERLEKKAKKVGRTKTKRGGVKKERKKKKSKDKKKRGEKKLREKGGGGGEGKKEGGGWV